MSMTFQEARDLGIAAATDAQLSEAWAAHARQISYHHADDSGGEWDQAKALMPHARSIEAEIRKRGLPRPTGKYLMYQGDRINWETGHWSPGWDWKKRGRP